MVHHHPHPIRALRTALAMLALLGGFCASALAEVHCTPADAHGIAHCRAGLSPELMQRMDVRQQKSQWCWAAALAMVFARYGHQVPQEEIVERLYGEAVDRPLRGRDFATLIGGDFVARDGSRLAATATRAQVAIGTDPAAAVRLAIGSLSQGRPLLISAQGHMVVLVAIRFQRFVRDGEVRITSGTVIDPLPTGGIRPLQAAETVPDFIAAVSVAPALARGGTLVALAPAAPPAP